MLLKFAGAAFTGSLGLLSEAIHSGTDVLSSSIALASVKVAEAPPDEDHPYGHGKVESLAGFGESILLFGVVVYVVIEAAQRLIGGSHVESVPIGIWLMAVSAVGATAVGLRVQRIARQTGSLALLSNAQHLFVDAVTSVGVLIALLVVELTGWQQADPVFALILAVWMSIGAYKLCNLAYHELIDVRLPNAEVEHIKRLTESSEGILSFHRLRTRRVGSVRHIDLHIVVPREWSVVTAHDCADRLEKLIERELAPAHAVIHVDPFEERPTDSESLKD